MGPPTQGASEQPSGPLKISQGLQNPTERSAPSEPRQPNGFGTGSSGRGETNQLEAPPLAGEVTPEVSSQIMALMQRLTG